MGNNEIRFNNRINKLRRIISIYTRFLKMYEKADVLVGKKYIIVRFYKPKEDIWGDKDEREFPVVDLGKMISFYKTKLATEFKNRHK